MLSHTTQMVCPISRPLLPYHNASQGVLILQNLQRSNSFSDLEMQKKAVTNAFSFCCWPLIGGTFCGSVAFGLATVCWGPALRRLLFANQTHSQKWEKSDFIQGSASTGLEPSTGTLKDCYLRAQSRPTVGPKIAPEWKSSSWVFFKICQTFCSLFILNHTLDCVNGLWLHISKTLLREGTWGLWCMCDKGGSGHGPQAVCT